MDLLPTLLDSQGAIPAAACMSWRPGLQWSHAGFDALIAISFLSIAGVLAIFAWKRSELIFGAIFWSLAFVLVACGVAHAFGVWTIWQPYYGASAAVNPTMIGGLRMASELIRPEVNEFLDQMLRDKNKNLRIEEVQVPAGSGFLNMTLKDTPIRRETRLLVVAVRDRNRDFVYNPEPDYLIQDGTTLIVMGEAESVMMLRKLMAESVSSSSSS